MRQKAERTLGRYGPRIGAAGRTIPMMLCGLSAWHAGHSQIVIAGDAQAADALKDEVARHYLPFAIVIPIAGGAAHDALSRLLPFTESMTGRGRAAAYVCRDFTCRQPVTTPDDLARELNASLVP